MNNLETQALHAVSDIAAQLKRLIQLKVVELELAAEHLGLEKTLDKKLKSSGIR